MTFTSANVDERRPGAIRQARDVAEVGSGHARDLYTGTHSVTVVKRHVCSVHGQGGLGAPGFRRYCTVY